ncbi:hypothetical protein KQI86_19900 [Clostridium sp. MSJ-11]|uniref:Uncharacterized protein n=1 Tax=Clostridium mobile TaxID=2841512 RepID=A0ABS6EPG1_9CLOT|nr:hypothetical protein [Clostridium mobile]MBU5486551.1 hypothetical protein [Clostridium mobile]
MSDTHFRVKESQHIKMKEIAKKKGVRYVKDVYDEAIENYIREYTQESIVSDTNLELYINNRITKAEDHLASMLGRTGMDVSMVLMGLIMFLEKATNLTREELYRKLRVEGARYFSTSIKNDKEK